MIQVTKIKKFVRSKGFRFNKESVDGINRQVEKLVLQMLKNVEQSKTKTLKIEHTSINEIEPVVEIKNECKRCNDIPEMYLFYARQVIKEVCDKAYIMAKKIKAGKLPGVRV